MTEFIDRPGIAEEDRFPGLAEMVEDLLTPQWEQMADPLEPDRTMAMYVERLHLNLPVELQTLRDADNRFTLGTSPPTQWIETSVQPVWHRLRVTLELEHDDPGHESLES